MSGSALVHVLPWRVRDFAPLMVAYYAMLWLLSAYNTPLIPAVVDLDLPRRFYHFWISVINYIGCGRYTTLMTSGAEVCTVTALSSPFVVVRFTISLLSLFLMSSYKLPVHTIFVPWWGFLSFFSSSRHFSLYGPLASVLIILNTPATAALIYNHIMKKGESIMQSARENPP